LDRDGWPTEKTGAAREGSVTFKGACREIKAASVVARPSRPLSHDGDHRRFRTLLHIGSKQRSLTP
jgi:hypothetical protein